MSTTVIIREIRTQTATHFVLKDTRTGVSKTWIPPKKLDESQYDQVLEFVARQFSEEVNMLPSVTDTPTNITPDIPFSEMTVAQFGRYMMQRKTIRIAEYTRDTWQSCLNNRIYPSMGSRLIRTIVPADIEDFLWRLQAEGLSHSTVMKYYSLLKVLFRQAYRCEAFDRNPMDRVERPQPRKDEMIAPSPSCYSADKLAP